MLFGKMIEKAYRAQLFSRCDDTGCVFYFSAKDFDGLICEPFEFSASAGHTLKGAFYSYDAPKGGRLIVFDHGMGGGHRSYMREIEMLARHGYLVFAYDHTGCMESGGSSTNGFAQSLCDLNDAINALKSSEKCKNMSIAVVGHSWGGFSTLNIAAFHPEITHSVAMSGFVSPERIIRQNFHGLLGGFFSRAMQMEREANPKFYAASAENSLKKTDARVLVIHSEDDKTVKFEPHFGFLKKALSDRASIEFLAVCGKGHNPNFTEDAVKYKDAFFADFKKKLKRGELSLDEQKKEFVASYDWHRMTAQDESLWGKIFDFLDN